MYVPKHFEETRLDVLHGLVREHPLGTIVTMTPRGLEANHVPFEIVAGESPLGTLRGHVARANPIWRDCAKDVEALVVFSGPSAYVSPSWYATKSETGKVVPTWNYAVVHARGPLRAIDDRAWLRGFVTALTNRFEAGLETPWKVTDAPDAFIDQMLGAIVGIEVPLTQLVGKWKVSQNRPERDRAGTVQGLARDGSDAANAMAEFVRAFGRQA